MILVMWKMLLVNRSLTRNSTLAGIHAVAHRDAVRSREYLQSVGSGVR